MKGILEVYKHALSYVVLSGPTLFSKVIEMASSYARQAQKEQNYAILLIITDGVINDMRKTLDAYVDCVIV